MEIQEVRNLLTNFGKALRRIRLERDELLKNMSEKLGVTPAYLSAIENGKKKATQSLCDRIIAEYQLQPDETDMLMDAYFSTQDQVVIPTQSMEENRQNLSVMFARKINEINETDMEKILKILEDI